MTHNLRLASLNIGTIKQRDKRQLLFHFIICSNLDVIALQELAFISCDILEKEFDFIANIGPNSRGTGFLVRKEVGFSEVNYGADGRILKFTVQGMNLVNLYAPAGRKKTIGTKAIFPRITTFFYSLEQGTNSRKGGFQLYRGESGQNCQS